MRDRAFRSRSNMGGTSTVLGFSGGVVARSFEKSSPMVAAVLAEQCYCCLGLCLCSEVYSAHTRKRLQVIAYEERRVILIQGVVIASACFNMRVESIHPILLLRCMDAEFHNFKHPCLFPLKLLSLCALSTTGDTIEQYLMNMASPSPMLPALWSGTTAFKAMHTLYLNHFGKGQVCGP